MSILNLSKNLGMRQNVLIRVIDQTSGKVVQQHVGHNTATNTMITGIAHYLIGDGVLNQASDILSKYIPRYISLGTMGLINQEEDSDGLPAGIGGIVDDLHDEEIEELEEQLRQAEERLEEAKNLLLNECPYFLENGKCYTGDECQTCSDRIQEKREQLEAAQEEYDSIYEELMGANEVERFIAYIDQRPGYGADGYDENENNNRKWFGLGYPYSNYNVNKTYDHVSGNDEVTYGGIRYKLKDDVDSYKGIFTTEKWERLPDSEQPANGKTVNLELISHTFPRTQISFRDIVPEIEAELPKTVDVIYSAMISTGALAQFRESDKDYIFITEAGLWANREWGDSGENGLLAAYRLAPTDPEKWDMTIDENRDILKRSILRVGVNQVVQVVWKLQIGSIDEFGNHFDYFGTDNPAELPDIGNSIGNSVGGSLGSTLNDSDEITEENNG